MSAGGFACQDWEKEHFGIRNFHQKADLSDNVTIDENAPKVTKRRRHRFLRKKSKEERVAKEPFEVPIEVPKKIELKMRKRGRSRDLSDQTVLVNQVPTFSSLLAAKPSFAEFKQNFMETLNQDDDNVAETKDNFQLDPEVSDSLRLVKVRLYDVGK